MIVLGILIAWFTCILINSYIAGRNDFHDHMFVTLNVSLAPLVFLGVIAYLFVKLGEAHSTSRKNASRKREDDERVG